MQVDKPTQEELNTFLKNLPHDELTRLIVTRAHCDNRVPIPFVCRTTGASCGIDNDGMKLAVYEQGLRAKAVFDELGKTVAEEAPLSLKDLFATQSDKGAIASEFSRRRLLIAGGNRLYRKPVNFPIISESTKDSGGGFDTLAGCMTFNEPGIAITDKYRLPTRGPIPVGLDVTPSDHFYVERDLCLGIDPRKRSASTERFEAFIDKLPIEELFEIGDLIIKNLNRGGLGSYRSVTLEQEERIYQTDLPLVYDTIKSRFNTDPCG